MILLEPGMVIAFPKTDYTDAYTVRLLTVAETEAIRKKALLALRSLSFPETPK